MVTSYIDFLKKIHDSEKSIIKSAAKKAICFDEIKRENDLGNDIYFVVNSGGTKDKEITKFNACFIDFDCGRDENNNYYPIQVVSKYKADVLEKIKAFELDASFIVETRNGYHVYWLLKGNTVEADWRMIQQKLINKFNSDAAIKNPARLMRLPFTKWIKDKSNPFEVKLVEQNEVQYDIETLKNVLKNVSQLANTKGSKVGGFRQIHKKEKNNSYLCIYQNSTLIKSNDIEGLRELVDAKNSIITFYSDKDCLEYITHEIDLADFLGIGNSNSFRCIMHDDHNPSASIFISKRGEYFYKCHSASCEFQGNIIRIVEALQGCSRPEAIRFIKAVYNLQVEESEWIKEQKAILDENIRMLMYGELEETEPEIHSVIRRYYNELIMLNTIAYKNIYTEDFSDGEENVIFYISQNHLAKLTGKSQSATSVRLALMAFLKLCNKIEDDKAPATLCAKAKQYAIENKLADTIQFYSIPSYSYNRLKASKEKASAWKEKGCTVKGMSRELIYRTFGQEEADRVYPKRQGESPTEASDKFQEKFEKFLIKAMKKGYAVEKEILAKISGWRNLNEVRAKRILSESIDSLNLQRVRANKELKERYNIKCKGYPFIIIAK